MLLGDEVAEAAILAGGCFWGVRELVRKLRGVISTRVGYTGGDVPNATYRNHHGDRGHPRAMRLLPLSAAAEKDR